MKLTRILLPGLMAVAVLTTARAQIVPGAVALPDSITGTRVLSADTVYQLVNTVKVGPGALLSIPAGTLIYGNVSGTRSCLQIERGGKIFANGTADKPIIFTSAKPQGQKAPGDWGGIIVLGNATINPTGGTAVIEGGTNGIYGGADDTDSSGVLRYLRIEFGGLAFSADNEINGLTLAGVGNRTVVENIQVSYNNDDGIEWFGGTVNGRRLISYAAIDDDFDTDFGYRGRNQFLFSMKDSLFSDLSAGSSSNGFESDNDATGSGNTPLSKPIFSNVTIVGPWRDTAIAAWGQDFTRAAHIRRNTDFGLFNSVLTGWPVIRIDGTGLNTACPQSNDFAVQNNVVTGKKNNGTANSEVEAAGGQVQATVDGWFDCAGAGNTRAGNHPGAGILAVTQSNLTNPDPRPNNTTSPARTGASFAHTLLGSGNNFSFTSTTYRGAFDPATNRDQQWDWPWSNYNPRNTTYTKVRTGWNLVGLANTPVSDHKDSIFRNAQSSAFRYSAGYTVDNNLDAGVGYWVKLGDERIIEQEGTTVALPRAVSVQAGWNLVCTGASASATASNTTASGTTIQSSFFGFSNGYTTATTLEPGRAYWVKCSAAGTLTFNP